MRRRTCSCLGILCGLLLCAGALPVRAQIAQRAAQAPDSEINVTADKLSAQEGGNQIEATGNVEIKKQETTLKAEEVRLNRETQDVEAKGNVSLDDPEWKVKSADALQLNLGAETGEIQNGDVFVEQGHLSISGRKFQKFGGQTYHVDDAFFTTCLCESGRPPWTISADSMDLNAAGVGTIRNGYFYILDVPVFYLPYGLFPLKTDRQTGLLLPKIGHSSKDGFRFQQPFFWAPSKSTDVTFAMDVETRARIGALGEFRTVFNRESDFRLDASYFNENLRTHEQDAVVDRTIADPEIPVNRWSLIGTHRYTTASNWLTYSDFATYGDDLFTRELIDRLDLPGTKEVDIRRSRFGESRFGAFRSWNDTFLQGEWNFYQDFIQPDAGTLQRTPQMAFWGRRFFDSFPLEFRWRAAGVNYLRREGGDGLRLDLRPEAVLPLRFTPFLFGSLSVAPRETLYHLYTPVKSSDHNVSRELVEIRGNIGTNIGRIYPWQGLGMSRIKHVLEPELSYLFVPGTDQSRIPIMDGVDRVNRRNVLTFAVTNRIWGKFANPLAAPADKNVESLAPVIGDVRELAQFKLALSYDIDQERKGGNTLSDLDMNLRLAPTGYLNIGVDGGLNPGPWQVTQLRATFGISDPRPLPPKLDADFNRPNAFNFAYYFLRQGPNGFLADNANFPVDPLPDCTINPADPRCSEFHKNVVGNISGNLLYHLSDHVLLTFNSTYDARDTRFIGVHAATKILSTCECWSVTFAVRHDINPSKTSFNFDFNLLGLGAQQSTLK